MIKHLFKLIWNRKRSNILLLTEIFLAFMLLFTIFTIFFYNYDNYLEPVGFNTERVWRIDMNTNSEETEIVREKMKEIKMTLKSFNEIEESAICGSFANPYSNSTWSNSFTTSNGIDVKTIVMAAGENFPDLLGINIYDGRWFDDTDKSSTHKPVLVNDKFREMFGEDLKIGQVFDNQDDEGNIDATYKVIGFFDRYKYKGEFSDDKPMMFNYFDIETEKHMYYFTHVLIKVKPGTKIDFEEKLVKRLTAITKGWNIKIDMLDELRDSMLKDKMFEITVPSAIAFFLILNVALGLMGVLWYSINRRKSEVGLRRAIGASGRDIAKQIIFESLVLGTLSISIGLVFAIQYPLLNLFNAELLIYFVSIIVAAIFLYCVIAVCSFYPSMLASRILPAEALHDE